MNRMKTITQYYIPDGLKYNKHTHNSVEKKYLLPKNNDRLGNTH